MAAVTMLGLVMVLGARTKDTSVADEIRARQFIVIDKNGKVRAVLGDIFNPDNVPNPLYGLEVFDPTMQKTISLYDRGTLGGATFDLGGSHSSISLNVEQEATVTLETYTQERLDRNRLLGHLLGEAANQRISWDEYKARAAQGVTAISILSKAGKPSVMLTDDKRNARTVIGHTELKTPVTGVIEQRPVSSLILLNDAENVIWKAP